MRKYLFLLFVIVVINSCITCYGNLNQPLDFAVTYYKEMILSDGTKLTSTSKLFCKENKMFRYEIISKVNGREMPSVSLIEIKRLDQNLIQKIEPKEKKCIEQQLTPETSFPPLIGYWEKLKANSEKICETKILDYDCEKFQEKDNPKHVFWLTKGTGILLREEEDCKNYKYTTIAKELKFEILDNSLFEVPKDYTIIKLRLSTDEDLKKVPPLTPSLLGELLLEGVETGILLKGEDISLLSKEKIQILKKSITNGTNLKEVAEKIFFEKRNEQNPAIFLIGAGIINYDHASGYLYIEKRDIYRKTEEQHYYDEKWKKKFLSDGYMIKPSEEIRQIID